ncbi:hypothetical protein MPTK1_8g12650 [Marchantia polymorpha subsp. ruderalis]|uniref:Uncharacterized protein n=1 Tax=Marchantia polymorpha TaxID=3197 RepID=A0A2R6WJT7_MARPO|nr:hypothetical protein MARPO_0083s0055 [Marchantia polymorpha]BBN19674.1 hypothetical protein Mp_8g12650 [Marchantia polymorpha subsp. ruderalis]|eukprot:PTQ34093.1 hypothetical protein MARPO_0083s0055 [Marchantia polymorpha]
MAWLGLAAWGIATATPTPTPPESPHARTLALCFISAPTSTSATFQMPHAVASSSGRSTPHAKLHPISLK